MEGLTKPEQSEGFGADRVLGFKEAPTDVGDEKKRHGGRFFDVSHREQSQLGEICTLVLVLAFVFVFVLVLILFLVLIL